MNIGSGNGYPATALSNFSPHEFIFDGVYCSSMEGVLQAFKFDKIHIQEYVCTLVGLAAKKRGQSRNKAWKTKQVLWWKGKEYPRQGDEYKELLTRAYDALFQNKSFQKALKSTNNAILKHSIGKSNPRETVLTETEFIYHLNRLRNKL